MALHMARSAEETLDGVRGGERSLETHGPAGPHGGAGAPAEFALAADGNLEGVPGTLAFTDVDWDVWQSVAMIAGHDPDIDHDTATLTHTAAGGSYAGQSADVTVTIVDDDAAGVSLDPTRVTVTEGGAGATYTAVLDSQPSADVTVTIGGAGSEVSLDKSSLTFAAGNWDTPQTVTVTAVDDTIDGDIETVTLSHTTASSDDDYDSLARTLGVTVRDNDSAAVVAPAAVTVTEGGAGVAYQRLGRRRWKKASGYQRQARVENAVFRYKSIIGDGLRARTPGGRQTETLLACNVLNRMTELGRPASYSIGR